MFCLKNNFLRFTQIIVICQMLMSLSCHAFIKEFGLGDNGVAYPQSAYTARYNPAGILEVGDRVDIGGGFCILMGTLK